MYSTCISDIVFILTCCLWPYIVHSFLMFNAVLNLVLELSFCFSIIISCSFFPRQMLPCIDGFFLCFSFVIPRRYVWEALLDQGSHVIYVWALGNNRSLPTTYREVFTLSVFLLYMLIIGMMGNFLHGFIFLHTKMCLCVCVFFFNKFLFSSLYRMTNNSADVTFKQ